MSDNLLSRGLNRFGYDIEFNKGTPFLTDPTDPKLPSIRIWLVAVLGLTLMTTKSEVHRPDSGDAREYLELAYNIYHHGVFADRAAEMSPQPTLGREPGYAMFLAGLLLVDSKFRMYCLKSQAGCPIENYTLPVWTNRALVAIVGLLVLWITARLTLAGGNCSGFCHLAEYPHVQGPELYHLRSIRALPNHLVLVASIRSLAPTFPYSMVWRRASIRGSHIDEKLCFYTLPICRFRSLSLFSLVSSSEARGRT